MFPTPGAAELVVVGAESAFGTPGAGPEVRVRIPVEVVE